jgi:penicillin G amidase
LSAGFVQTLRTRAATSALPAEGRLELPGLRAAVAVRPDDFGIAAITAEHVEDLWLAQGFVSAAERLFQLELAIRSATGRLSEIFGERTFEADRFVRTIGLAGAARTHLRGWTGEDATMHARFRQGARLWVERMPTAPIEYQLLDVEPSLPEDPADWAACYASLAWMLSNNWEKELLRARIRRALGSAGVETLLPPVSGGNGSGSNAWAVAGNKTASGKPLLAGDPHLPALQPSPWVEVCLCAPGYHARGVALVFGPGIILGATPHHAWSATNVTGDVQDLFEEREDAVISQRSEAIRVRGEAEPRTVVVRETRHGPILTHAPIGTLSPTYASIEGTYALRWTGRDVAIRPSLTVAAARATSFEEFRAAVLQVGCPGQNFVYADVDGTIAYQLTGAHPVRSNGDGTEPVPGWNDEHEWIGVIEPEELPTVIDPPEGFIVTANDGAHAAASVHPVSNDFHEPHRANRITALLRARDDHDVASMAAIQRDTVSLPAIRTIRLLTSVTPADDRQRDAIALLRDWDGDLDAGSHAAALYEAWTRAIARRALGPRLGQDLCSTYIASAESWTGSVLPRLLDGPNRWVDDDLVLAALDEAVEEVGGRTWGDIHRLVLAHPLASIPGLEALFVAADSPLGGDGHTVAQGGIDGPDGFRAGVIASWRAVWDLGDLDRSGCVFPSGASGNPGSPHWNDQLSLYLQGRLRPSPVHLVVGDEALTIAPG